MSTPTLLRLNTATLLGDKLDATEAERAQGWRAMLAANAILRDQKSADSRHEDAELCGHGIVYANRRLRGELVSPRFDW